MDNNAKKPKYFTLMLVPHDADGKPISLKLSARLVYGGVAFLTFCLVLAASSLIYSTLISRRLVNYAATVKQGQEQQAALQSLHRESQKVSREIVQLSQEENELRRLLGLKENSGGVVPSTKQGSGEVKAEKIKLNLNTVSEKIADRTQGLAEIKSWVEKIQTKMARTPSIWPVAGRVVSRFGYRTNPWRGFHSGLDIDARYGAPVRATADGVVTFLGWSRGYGKTVEISHGNGVLTRYGHCSGYNTLVGERVKRGEIIAYVGATGWATGSHLHYEVERWGQVLNPVAYLENNLLSASRLWR